MKSVHSKAAKQTRALVGPIHDVLGNIAEHEEEYSIHRLLQSLLNAARDRLSMEVAFISEFTDGQRIFRQVSSDPAIDIVKPGEGGPLEESYCIRVVQGLLPELIRDAQKNPEALKLAATKRVPVGAHVSVPIRLTDGTVYGTFCAFSRNPNQNLDARDLAFLRVLADISTVYLEHQLQAHGPDQQQRQMLASIIDKHLINTVFQPIVRLTNGHTVGYEALTRTLAHRLPPDQLFRLAITHGMNDPLSEMAITSAFQLGGQLPRDVYISINAGPEELLSGLVEKLFREQKDPSRYVVEITEHAIVSDYEEMMRNLARLRRLGVRIAVDDAGAGYASFRHILCLKPDIIKLDISLVRNIHCDKDQQDLVAALMEFSRRRRSVLIAEGLEDREELKQLMQLGIEYVQGYFLSRPGDVSQFTTQAGDCYACVIFDNPKAGQERAGTKF
jgi:EAL domain-containing protein (putative c-di-GMP-specific phosphodiesterase class I)